MSTSPVGSPQTHHWGQVVQLLRSQVSSWRHDLQRTRTVDILFNPNAFPSHHNQDVDQELAQCSSRMTQHYHLGAAPLHVQPSTVLHISTAQENTCWLRGTKTLMISCFSVWDEKTFFLILSKSLKDVNIISLEVSTNLCPAVRAKKVYIYIAYIFGIR